MVIGFSSRFLLLRHKLFHNYLHSMNRQVSNETTQLFSPPFDLLSGLGPEPRLMSQHSPFVDVMFTHQSTKTRSSIDKCGQTNRIRNDELVTSSPRNDMIIFSLSFMRCRRARPQGELTEAFQSSVWFSVDWAVTGGCIEQTDHFPTVHSSILKWIDTRWIRINCWLTCQGIIPRRNNSCLQSILSRSMLIRINCRWTIQSNMQFFPHWNSNTLPDRTTSSCRTVSMTFDDSYHRRDNRVSESDVSNVNSHIWYGDESSNSLITPFFFSIRSNASIRFWFTVSNVEWIDAEVHRIASFSFDSIFISIRFENSVVLSYMNE